MAPSLRAITAALTLSMASNRSSSVSMACAFLHVSDDRRSAAARLRQLDGAIVRFQRADTIWSRPARLLRQLLHPRQPPCLALGAVRRRSKLGEHRAQRP